MGRALVLLPLSLLIVIALAAACSGAAVTSVYNLTTVTYEDAGSGLASQQFVDQTGQPALEAAQGFVVGTELVVTRMTAGLWFVFQGPWDPLTTTQLQNIKVWLLVSNGTHRYLPIRQLSLATDNLPVQIAGRGESLRLSFELNDTTTTLHTQNVYYIYPEVPVPRNYDPIHATETRIYWAQAQRDPESGYWAHALASLVRDTEDLLALGAASWSSVTDELALAFGGTTPSSAPVLAFDLSLECEEEEQIDHSPLPPSPSTTLPLQVPGDSEQLSPTQTGAVATIAVVGAISILMLIMALVVWKRIRAGNNETRFTWAFDSVARCTGYDPSGFAALDPPEVRATKERNELIGTLEAHRYQGVKVTRKDRISILLDSDSDSMQDMSESDIV